MLRGIKRNKRGVSVLIGYALLIAFAITTSIVTYNWMKTYVPTDILDCPEGVSVLVKDITCSTVDGKYQIDLTIENTGRFDLAGYFIYASNDTNGTLVTIDLTKSLTSGGNNITGAVLFLSTQDNSFEISGGDKSNRFVTKENITSVEITPVRFVEENGKMRFASCGDANVREFVRCEGRL